MINIRDEEILKAFGKHLQKLRKAKGVSQSELAHQTKVAVSSIGRIERGEINATLCTIVHLAHALDVEQSEILDFKS